MVKFEIFDDQLGHSLPFLWSLKRDSQPDCLLGQFIYDFIGYQSGTGKGGINIDHAQVSIRRWQ